MEIRVTSGGQFSFARTRLQESALKKFRTEMDLATGKRIRSPSDDPAGAERLLGLLRAEDSLKRRVETAGRTGDLLSVAAASLQTAADRIGELSARALEGLSGVLSETDRAGVADDIARSLELVISEANARVEGRFLFGGSQDAAPPYRRITGPDGLERIVYAGDARRRSVEVGSGVFESTSLPGQDAFGPAGPRGATLISGGGTGLKTATGFVDSATGRGRIALAHGTTSFGAPGSGVATHASGLLFGATSDSGDTILGPSHTLTLTVNPGGTGGTISLNGGASVSFSTADADLAVTGPDGESTRLDLRGVVAGFSGSIAIGATGTVSTDGGATRSALDFSAPVQQVLDRDGFATHVDPREVRKVGTERARYQGTLGIFDVVLALRDLLKTKGTKEEMTAALDEARTLLPELDNARDRALSALADVGGAVARVEFAVERAAEAGVAAAARRSNVGDVDLSEAASRLYEQENVFQATLLMAARIGRTSLMQYL